MKDWVGEYESIRPKYEILTKEIEDTLTLLICNEGIKFRIESRTKSVESFAEKLTRKSYDNPLHNVTDFSGVRVVVDSLDDVTKVCILIQREFEIDVERSVDKSRGLEPNEFGYLSKQFVLKLAQKSEMPCYTEIKDMYAEVQVRTALQHTWASIEHSLNYKSKITIPDELKRSLFRLSALFEIADKEFNSIIQQRENLVKGYGVKTSEQNLNTELNDDSLCAYIYDSEGLSNIAHRLEHECGWDTIADYSKDLTDCIQTARRIGVNTVQELDLILNRTTDWAWRFIVWLAGDFEGDIAKDELVRGLLIASHTDSFQNQLPSMSSVSKADKVLLSSLKYQRK
jgi:putative GTP pyrophosphokinase